MTKPSSCLLCIFFVSLFSGLVGWFDGVRSSGDNHVGQVALSSLARILGECLTIQSQPALFFFGGGEWRLLARAH